jgi:hypothetical protein
MRCLKYYYRGDSYFNRMKYTWGVTDIRARGSAYYNTLSLVLYNYRGYGIQFKTVGNGFRIVKLKKHA